MARVETNVETGSESESDLLLLHSPLTDRIVFVRPARLKIEKLNHARPGPTPPQEQSRLSSLAQSMRENGQLTPVLVTEYSGSGGNGSWDYALIDGRRRRDAALLIEREDSMEFPLACVVASGLDDPLKAGIHANKHAPLTPLQFAYLCKQVRKVHGWHGTKEVAEYLGVSRAQVSQHDKLLTRPEGMTKSAYEDLLSKVGSRRWGSEAAFYTLTHVEPVKADQVIARAEELATEETGETEEFSEVPEESSESPQEASEYEESQSDTSTPQQIDPGESETRQTGKEKRVRSDGKRDKDIKTPEWMKEQKQKSKERVAAKKAAKTTAKETARPSASVGRRHVEKAAREAAALKSTAPQSQSRGVPDLLRLLELLSGDGYPKLMREFADALRTSWWTGQVDDEHIVWRWEAIASDVRFRYEREG
jgi:ParB/RepB/Spo0J family partition protein